MPIQCKPILWTRAKVDELTHGEWICGANLDWYATGVRREPGRVVHGDLFITAGPIGQNLVANNINRLFAQGAVAVVTSVRPSTNTPWGPVLLVADTNHVYESLAADSLARATAKIIGVTGSVGKTGTKDAIAHALSHQGTVLSTPGSANSDTVIMELLCQLAPNIDYAVAELGMLGPNSMSRKAALCQPHVALITAIGTSHRHHHDSELSIARTKSDILTGVRPGGVAVLQPDGRFIYYYDAATDTRRDHEHPGRDPETDPYYNLLRHGGGVITLLLDEQMRQAQGGREPFSAKSVSIPDVVSRNKLSTPSPDHRRHVIGQPSDFFVEQLVDYETANGEKAAYALYNRKAKLGGSGVGLYALALYQRLFNDDRYADAAQRLATHLVNEINEQGEFRYYHI